MKCKVEILPSGKIYDVESGTSLHDVLKESEIEFPCGGKGTCGKCKVRLIKGDIYTDEKHKRMLEKMGLSDEWRLACHSKVHTDITIEAEESEMRIQSDDNLFKFKPEKGYGIAVDLGSTTIVAQLIDLSNGKIIDSRSTVNPQSHYGADIISRISFAMESEENAETLMWIVRNHIGSEISNMINDSNIKDNVKIIVIAGNTVMHHLFSGINVSPLAVAPFESPNNDTQIFTASSLKWDLPETCRIEFLPNLSHFVGSDILCGIQACDMQSNDGCSLLVDLGTNGEIALVNNNKIICTSTAAGPAFEGINISCGMRATSGAIYAVDWANDQYSVKTVNNTQARGLCGSGLVEAIHSLFVSKRIDSTGTVTDNSEYIDITENVKLTIADIREFQLAKAALAAGIFMILKKNDIKPEDVNSVYITGGLGNYLNIEKIKQLGLFNEFDDENIHKISNASLAGCRELLFEYNRANIEKIKDNCSFCALESYSDFQEVYCDNLFFN